MGRRQLTIHGQANDDLWSGCFPCNQPWKEVGSRLERLDAFGDALVLRLLAFGLVDPLRVGAFAARRQGIEEGLNRLVLLQRLLEISGNRHRLRLRRGILLFSASGPFRCSHTPP